MMRLLEALARQAPLVVVLEDLHWADAAFLEVVELIEHMAAGALLLGLTRPDESTRATRGDVLQLQPLDDADVARLVVGLGGPVIPAALDRIVGLAQGNPLYAEQLFAAGDDGELSTIPESLVGLLSMRLDQLGPGERDILRCAAVGGLDVDARVVGDLLPPDARPFVASHLEALVRKRFLDRTPGGGLRFAHVLLQLAAYQSITLEDRSRLDQAYKAQAAQQASTAMPL
jgi:predicted ATPase